MEHRSRSGAADSAMLALPPPPRLVFDKHFEELKLTGNLPTPSGVGLALLRAMQRDDVELDELAEIVSSDPTLTGRLLKLANSAAHSGAQRTRTVREAAARLACARCATSASASACCLAIAPAAARRSITTPIGRTRWPLPSRALP